jgi:hypothetical protein
MGERGDTLGADLVPPGYGSLRQDDIAIKIQLPSVLVRAIPLNEPVIRLLAPDSYRALRQLAAATRDAVDRSAREHGVSSPSLWYISYYGLERDARFSPLDILLQSGGRDFRPLDVVPLSTGFGEHRVSQREVQSAVFVFGEGIDPGQPLVVTVEGVANASWSSVLPTLQRERALVRARAGNQN